MLCVVPVLISVELAAKRPRVPCYATAGLMVLLCISQFGCTFYYQPSILPAYGQDVDAAFRCRGHQESALSIRPRHACNWLRDVASLGIQQVQEQRLPVLSLVSAVNALH